MRKKTLTTIALRYSALFLDVRREDIDMKSPITPPLTAFLLRLRENGYCVSEELLHGLCAVPAETLADITHCIDEVLGVHLNWAPLVKGWLVPTGETFSDHLITFVANIFGKELGFEGDTLPCGHLIPNGTFPLERYNGCPFCGKPFKTTDYVFKGQASKLKELRLLTETDMEGIFRSLLESPTPLDGTQKDSLEQLLTVFPLPADANITMKETAMLAVDALVKRGEDMAATQLLKTPTDVLRYLWFKKTGQVQIIEPKTLLEHAKRVNRHMWAPKLSVAGETPAYPSKAPSDKSSDAVAKKKEELKLKYDRRTCRRVATWLNATTLTAQQAAENMNSKRGMWVRMIHALRLGEYSRRDSFGHLAEILDVFYKQDYTTWQGNVDKARIAKDADRVFHLLKQRSGLFARCLFATMLRFGPTPTLAAFSEIADKIPARLLLSLGNAAELYFDPKQVRLARPITGGTHKLNAHKLLALYNAEELQAMFLAVMDLYKSVMKKRFADIPNKNKTMYISPALFDIPVSVGDRSTTIQDTSCAVMGTRFPVEGDTIRLFLQWGKGLHEQDLDMDLSCIIALSNNDVENCYFGNLTAPGARHSGDIRHIPEMVGTAEYIELSIPELEEAKASYVTFTCNAYSTGTLSPNLVVGWMDSSYPMKVSEEDGVAYDPSCVQHMVRISQEDLSKGLVFGVLDVAKREIVWIEMPFSGQTVRSADKASIEAMLKRLEMKLSIGELLTIKAEAQGMTLVDTADQADESYTYEWSLNPAEVSRLLSGNIKS